MAKPDKKKNIKDKPADKKEQKKDYAITKVDRFQHRTRYFVDSGIIGSMEFVYQNYLRFKDRFQSKEKKPKPVKGLKGIYSLKQ